MSRPTSRARDRSPAVAVVLLAGVAFIVVAVWLVPWSPVPGGMPDPVPADSAFTASEIAAGEHYAAWTRVSSWSGLAVQLAVVCALGTTRVRERLARRLPGRWWVQVTLAVLVVTLVLRVLALPFGVALQQHRLDHGLSTQSWWGYARDVATGTAVSVVVTSLGLLVLVGLARRWQRAWVVVGSSAGHRA